MRGAGIGLGGAPSQEKRVRRRTAAGAPVATGLASDRGVGYWTLRQRTVAAVMEESSGAHDARARHTTDTTLGPVGSPGFSGIPTGVGMVLDRRGTTHRSE